MSAILGHLNIQLILEQAKFQNNSEKIQRKAKQFSELTTQYVNNIEKVAPPYLCTHQASYKQERYFDLVDFLRLVDLTRPPYLFFSSTKSEFIRFINYLVEDKVKNWQVFDGAKRIAINTSASYSGKYEDNLVYKF